jgi:hypothetical protein
MAERAVLVPVGASLLARDSLAAGVREFTSRYSTRTERSFRQNRRRLERELRLVHRDLEKQSDALGDRVEKLLGEVQGRLSSVA